MFRSEEQIDKVIDNYWTVMAAKKIRMQPS